MKLGCVRLCVCSFLGEWGGGWIFWRKEFFLFSIFLFFYFFYLRLFIEIIHEPLSLEESTLAEDNSLQAQAYLVLDRREEVRQAPQAEEHCGELIMLTQVCDTYLYEYLNHQLYHNK